MSVILFSKKEVYQKMADSYETMSSIYNRHFYISDPESHKQNFYRSLRRMYFANVATFLCQYHDETPETDLSFIDPFTELEGKNHYDYMTIEEGVDQFLQAWSSLEYNTTTNDGEQYIAKEGHEFLKNYGYNLGRLLAEIRGRDMREKKEAGLADLARRKLELS